MDDGIDLTLKITYIVVNSDKDQGSIFLTRIEG